MSVKTTTCSACGSDLDPKAVICPKCGVPVKKKKKHTVLWVVIALIAILVIAATSGESNQPTKVNPSASASSVSSAAPVEKPSARVFTVGDHVEMNDVIVTFNSATQNKGSSYNRPAAGNIFLLCEFTIENNSSSELSVSSLMCFDAYVDDYSTSMSLAAQITETNKGQLDGTIAPGKKMNGVIGYEVPSDWKTFEVTFTPNFWSQKSITFAATNAG